MKLVLPTQSCTTSTVTREITLTASPASMTEGEHTRFTITADITSGPAFATNQTLTLGFRLPTDTTIAADHTIFPKSGDSLTFVIPAGQLSGSGTMSLQAVDDNLIEGDETFSFTGSLPGGETVHPATITIKDNDAPTVALSLSPVSVGEDGGPQTVAVTAELQHGVTLTEALTVTVSVAGSGGESGATAGTDFGAVGNFDIVIPPNTASAAKNFSITPTSDNLYEGDETLAVTGAASQADVVVTPATLTIADADTLPTLAVSVTPDSVAEGDPETILAVTVSIQGDSRFPDDLALLLDWANSASSNLTGATPGDPVDVYLEFVDATANGRVTLSAGQATTPAVEVKVRVADDNVVEGDEMFNFHTRDPVTLQHNNAVDAVVTIVDNDDPATPIVSISPFVNSEVTEGTQAQFDVQAVPSPAADVTVNLNIVRTDNGETGAATEDTVVIKGGGTGAALLSLATDDDGRDEPDGSIEVTVAAGEGYVVAASADDHTATMTVKDNDERTLTWAGGFTEAAANDGSVEGSVTATLAGGEFATDVHTSFQWLVTNAPSGLTPAFARTSNTVVTFTLEDMATAHAAADSVTNLTLSFLAGAFADGHPELIVGGTSKSDIEIDFDDAAAANPPGAPKNLVTYVVNDSISLGWEAPDSVGGSAITGYQVEVSDDGSAWTDLVSDTGSPNVKAAIDRGAAEGATRHYRVRAINADGAGPPSEVVTAKANTLATGKPVIVGPVQPGQALTVNVDGIVDPDGKPADASGYTFTWYVDGSEDDDGPTYTPNPSDVGSALSVEASFTGGNGASEAVRSDPVTIQAQANTPATGAPVITGSPVSGEELQAGPGDLADANGLGQVVAYQWQQGAPGGAASGWEDLEGETRTYLIVGLNLENRRLRVVASFTDGSGYAESRNSAPTVAVTEAGTIALSYSGAFVENTPPGTPDGQGTVIGVLQVTLAGETFSADAADHVTVTNVPAGLTPRVRRTGAQTLSMDLEQGQVTAHTDADDVDDLTIVFGDMAFSGEDATRVANSTKNDITIDFVGDAPTAPTPVVSIAAVTSPVTEGTAAQLTLTATPAPTSALTVNLSVASTDDDEAATTTTTTHQIPTGGSATFSVPTHNDDLDEPAGSIEVTVTAGTGYTVASSPGDTATVAVNDNDPGRGLTIAAMMLDEDAGATTITVTATGLTTQPYTCWAYTGAGGSTATPRDDFDVLWSSSIHTGAGNGAGTIPPGNPPVVEFKTSQSATVAVTVVDDNVAEQDETIVLRCKLSSGEGGAASGTITIRDDDTKGVTVSETAVTVPEAGGTDTYTVRLDSQPTGTVTVTPQSANVNVATVSGALTFTTGNWSAPQPVTVTGVDDAVANAGGERIVAITHTVTGADYAGESAESVTVTVTDDEAAVPERPAAPTLSVTDTGLSVSWSAPNEGGSPITDYDLRWCQTSTGCTQASHWTLWGETTPFTNTRFTLAFRLFEAGAEYAVQVRAANDAGPGPWSPSAMATPVAANAAPMFSDGPSTSRDLTETIGAGTITVGSALGNPIEATDDDDETIVYSLVDGEDAGSFSVGTGSRGAILRTRPGAAFDYETKGSYRLTVTAEDGRGGSDTIAVTINIIDVDEPPLAPAAPSLSSPTETSLAVNWTAPDNAGRPAITHYDVQYRVSGEAAWTDGPKSVSGTTAALSDLAVGTTYEVRVRAVNDEGDGVWSDPAALTIVEAPAFSIADAVSTGERGSVEFTVRLNPTLASGSATVRWATSTEPGDTASAGVDYTARSGTLTFGADVFERTVSVPILPDEIDEENETFTVTLSSPTGGATLPNPATATGTITDDDARPTAIALSVAPTTVSESGGPQQITVTAGVTGATTFGTAQSVAVSVGGGTATPTADYAVTAAPGTLTIPAGMETGSTTFTIAPANDGPGDNGETVTVSGTLSGVTVTSADLTIVEAPTLSIAAASAAEGDRMTFEVSLNPASDGTVRVDYATSSGAAVEGTDYTAARGTLTFPAGATSRSFTVATVEDRIDEGNETFTVTLSNPTGADSTLGAAAIGTPTATGTIGDDDATPTEIALSLAPSTVAESGGVQTITVTARVTSGTTFGTPQSVAVSVGGGTATPTTDYAATSPAAIAIAPGATEGSTTFTIAPVDDGPGEGDETIAVSGALSGVTVAPATLKLVEAPTFSIADAASTGERGSVVFTVSLDPPIVSGSARVRWATSTGAGDTATAGLDYTARSGTLTFGAGVSEQTVGVAIRGDSTDEENETFTVTLSDVTGGDTTIGDAVIGDATATGTIVDDDGAPAIGAVADRTLTEGDPGETGVMTFTVRLAKASGRTATVAFATADGTATAGADYTAASGTLTFEPGETVKTIEVAILGDDALEDDESFTLTLSAPEHAVLPEPAAAAGTIVDNDVAALAIDRTALTLNEAVIPTLALTRDTTSNRGRFGVRLLARPRGAVTVSLAADPPAGTVALSAASLTFTPANYGTAQWVTATAVDNAIADGNRSARIAVAANGGGYAGTGGAVAVTVVDDDAAGVRLSHEELTFSEAGGNRHGSGGWKRYRVVLNADPGAGNTVTVTARSTSDAFTVHARDWRDPNGEMIFHGGACDPASNRNRKEAWCVPQVVRLVGVDDAVDNREDPRTGTVTHSVRGYGGVASGPSLAVRVTDDERPVLSADDAASAAESGHLAFPVRLSVASEKTIAVDWATADGTALAGADYRAGAGTLTFRPGETEKTVRVAILPDSIDDDGETFSIGLSNPTGGAAVAKSPVAATGTITDDDGTPTDIALSLDPSGVPESGGPRQVTVTATVVGGTAFAADRTVTVSVAPGTAAQGTDYTVTAGPGAIVIPAGAASASTTFTIAPVDDGQGDNGETVGVSGSAGGGVSVIPAVLFIVESPTFSIAGATSERESGSLTFTVSLSPALGSGSASVRWAASSQSGDSATAGRDYTARSGTLHFARGQSVKTVSVPVRGDSLDEDNETFTVTLSRASGGDRVLGDATIGGATATGTITDDDDPPAIRAVTDRALTEGDTGDDRTMSFEVRLARASGKDVTVTYATGDDTSEGAATATAGADYTATTGTLAFAPGETRKAVEVPILCDEAVEGTETFLLTLGGAANATLPEPATARGTIGDNDRPGLTVGPARLSVNEEAPGNTGTFTVVLAKQPSEAVTVAVTAEPAGGTVTLSAASLSFTPSNWDTPQTVTVTGVNDNIRTGDRRATVTAEASGSGYGGRRGRVTVSVVDDDVPGVKVSEAELTVAEGGAATYTVELNTDPGEGRTVTVTARSSDGGIVTADADANADGVQNALSFTGGAGGDWAAAKTVTLAGIDDGIDNAGDARTATVRHRVSGYAGVGSVPAVAVTVSDGDTAMLSIADATSTGESGDLAFTVTLDPASGQRVTVDWTAGDSAPVSAKAGEDYTARSGTLTFRPGETEKTVRVPVLEDATDEADETFTVTLSEPSGGAALADATAAGTITDDDGPPTGIALSLDPAAVSESGGAQTVTVTATVTGGTAFATDKTVTVTVAPGTAQAGDFTATVPAPLTVPAGAKSGKTTFTLTPVEDTEDDGGETVLVMATLPGTAGAMARLTIAEAPTFSIADAASAGERGSVTFAVRLDPPIVSGSARVRWATSTQDGDTATAGRDYTARSGTLTFGAGVSEQTVSVPIRGDSLDEGDETFTVTLSGVSGGDAAVGAAILGTATARGTIKDDDALPALTLTAPAAVAEGDEGDTAAMTFTVRLSAASGREVTVDYATGSDTAQGTATAGADYTATTGTLTFAPGERVKTVEVAVLGDEAVEGEQSIALTLSNAVNATLPEPATATGTITDDDRPGLTVSRTELWVNEQRRFGGGIGSNADSFAVALDRQPSGTVTVAVTASPARGTVTLAPSALTFTPADWNAPRTVTVTGVHDQVYNHGHRRATVTVAASGGGYGGLERRVTVEVLDDERPGVRLTAGSLSVAEGGTGRYEVWLLTDPGAGRPLTATVTLSASPAGAVRIDTDPGTEGDQDTITFTGGHAGVAEANWRVPRTVTVTGVDDGVANEGGARTVTIEHRVSGYRVSLGGPSGGFGGVEAVRPVTVTVLDGDGPVAQATDPLEPGPCVADLGALAAGAEAVSLSGEAWDVPECRAHHVENRPARYYAFTLAAPATVSLALTSEHAAALFVSAGTPGNGWGTPPENGMAHRLETRRANGRLVHEEALTASLALEPGSYTAEAVLEARGADPAASFFGLAIAASEPAVVVAADTAPTVSDTAAFANHEATVGEAFSLTLPAADAGSGNGGPYGYILWKRGAGVEFGENGLVFDPATRTLSGTPGAPGAFDLAYQVHDGDANRSRADSFVEESALRITVSAAAVPEPVVAAGGAPTVSDLSALVDHDAWVGQPFSVTLPAADPGSGDGGPYDYNLWHRGAAASFTAGIDGLTFDAATRTLSGTPQRAGVYRMSYVVHDGDADRSPADAFRERERLSVTVRALPVLSAADARANESDGAIAFTLTLDTPAPVRATVAWATADGTAMAGSDYTAASGTAVFAPGATEATVSVAILDDAHDEGEETFRLVLSDPVNLRIGDGEAIGTIVNSDPLLNAWLARFGRSVAGQTVEALTERYTVAPGAGSHVTLGGQRLALTTGGTDKDPGSGPGQSLEKQTATPPPEDNAFAALASRDAWGAGGPGSVSGSTPLPGSGVIPGSGAIPGSPGSAEPRSMTGREFLLGSSFHLTTDGREPGSGRWTAWGRAALENFSGRDGGLSVDGEVVTGVFGADWDAGRWLGGLALTHSIGEGDLSSEGMALDYGVKSTVTAVNPYLRLRLTDRVTAWGLAGYGGGGLDLTVEREASGETPASTETYRTDLTMMLGAVGARGELVTPAESGGYGLALKGDAFWVRTESDAVNVGGGRLAASQGDASRARVTLEGSRRVELEGGGTLTPSLELGLRQDGGDAETGTGLEAGGGIAWADPSSGFSADLRARTLVAHAESGYREWGLSGAVKLQPGGAGRGLSFSLLPAFGAEAAGDKLWSARDAAALAPASGNADARGRLETELGYGLPAFDGGFTGTPYLGFGYSDTERKYRLGWRLTRPSDAGSFQFSLETSRRESANDNEPEHGIGFRATARW